MAIRLRARLPGPLLLRFLSLSWKGAQLRQKREPIGNSPVFDDPAVVVPAHIENLNGKLLVAWRHPHERPQMGSACRGTAPDHVPVGDNLLHGHGHGQVREGGSQA